MELAALAGLELDPWQQFVLVNSLGERPDGQWAAFEVGLVVSRQNGKGSILEARELAGLFLLDERLIVHSAHEFPTSLEAFRRLAALIDDTPALSKRVSRIVNSHGEEGIELKSGQRIRFRTRTKRGGRGFTADCVIFDEAMKIPESAHGAILPTLSARPNPQVWYTGSAVDQESEEHGVVLARIRERGLTGTDPSLAYFEWSAEVPLDKITPEVIADPESWQQANPALGIRISSEYVGFERAALDPRTFCVERLGAGDWPSTEAGGSRVMDPKLWAECMDTDSAMDNPVVLSFDITPDRSWATIAAAGYREDGKPHVEVILHRRGTKWVIDTLEDEAKARGVRFIFCDAHGPASSLLPEMENRNMDVTALSAGEVAQGCGIFYDAVVDSTTLRHLGTPELNAAVAGASTRPLGDSWAWSRKNSAVDISPLVATTVALWGLTTSNLDGPQVWSIRELMEEIKAEREADNK